MYHLVEDAMFILLKCIMYKAQGASKLLQLTILTEGKNRPAEI